MQFKTCVKCGKEKKQTRHELCSSCCRIGKPSWNKGLVGFMKGRKVSFDTRLKQSLSQRRELNHMWKGGNGLRERGQEPFKAAEWRKQVIERDSSCCTICGKFCMYPQTHHVKFATAYPEMQYDVDNGRTVCYDCHMIIHRKVDGYGKRGEFSESLEQVTLSQAWKETSLKVQRILVETKELCSMSVTPTRAPRSKDNIYAELTRDSEK